jgi:hypothetical protein
MTSDESLNNNTTSPNMSTGITASTTASSPSTRGRSNWRKLMVQYWNAVNEMDTLPQINPKIEGRIIDLNDNNLN